MSKIFSCFFPYSKKLSNAQHDVKNTGFLKYDSSASICELSYHHVDAVRIQKLEQEKKYLVEIMISQKEKSKKSFRQENTDNSNYYTDIEKHWKSLHVYKEYEENTYDYIAYN